MPLWSTLWWLAVMMSWAVPASGGAEHGATTTAATTVAPTSSRIYTRATVRDLPVAGAEPALVRLKIAPRGQLPFSTLTFQVDDRRLLDGMALGDEVGFIAERRPGGNTLTALRKVAPCVRFQNCPQIAD